MFAVRKGHFFHELPFSDRLLCVLYQQPLCGLLCRVPNILEYIREPLHSGLGDRSAYVRKTAVMGILKLFYVAPEFIKGDRSPLTFCVGCIVLLNFLLEMQ